MQRRYRLRHASDFERLRERGRRFHHPLLVLVIMANGRPDSRFAFSASKQIGKATVRNRAKRLMRESARRLQNQMKGGWDCLFIARRGAPEASMAQIEAAMNQILDRAQVLKKGEQSEGGLRG